MNPAVTSLDTLFNESLIAAQQPAWPDKSALDKAVAELKSFPPLVFAGECDELKTRIAQAARGSILVARWGLRRDLYWRYCRLNP